MPHGPGGGPLVGLTPDLSDGLALARRDPAFDDLRYDGLGLSGGDDLVLKGRTNLTVHSADAHVESLFLNGCVKTMRSNQLSRVSSCMRRGCPHVGLTPPVDG